MSNPSEKNQGGTDKIHRHRQFSNRAGTKRNWIQRIPFFRDYVTISLPGRKQRSKKRRFFPIALIIYLLIFLVTSIVSLIGGESAQASPKSTTSTAKVYPNIGEPSFALPCPTTITTEPGDTEGTQIASSDYGDYLPGGSPRPGCQQGIWVCPNETFSQFAPVSLPGNGNQDYVICLSAVNLSNPYLDPVNVTIPELVGCDPNARMGEGDYYVTENDNDPLPVCTDEPVPGMAGNLWICPSGYKADFLALGVVVADAIFAPLECNQENKNWVFPCSDVDKDLPNVGVIQADWLSGNHPNVHDPGPGAPTDANVGGRFVNTFAADTYNLQGVVNLKPYTLGIGLLLLTPVIILVGYQVMLGSITFRYANALQAIPRLVMGIGILVVSFTMTEMLISISNMITEGLVNLHSVLGYPQAMINGEPIAYTLENEGSAVSYRGMVVPMSRWGCAANKFVEILAVKFVMDVLAAIIPLFGNLVHLIGTITTFFMFIEHLGEFILLVLSIMLWAQVLIRIILLNYYILLAPIAFGCWALPGGQGQNVVNQWTKGFLSTLAIQIVQVFMITTMPLIIPVLPPIPSDSLGLMQGILTQLPPVIVMWMTVRAPSILGTSSAKAVTQAGSVAGGVVTAVGATAYNVV